MTFSLTRRMLLAGIPVMLAGAAAASFFTHSVPADLDLSRLKSTTRSVYVASLSPGAEPVEVGPMQAWTLDLKTADGKPVRDARIAVDGGMPQHGHGLPTAPRVTRNYGDGRFLVEGLRFSMPGWWELRFDIDGPAGSDRVTFNLVL